MTTLGTDIDAISIAEIVRRTGLKKTFVYDLARRGEIPSARVGGRVLVLREHYEQFVERLRKEAVGKGVSPLRKRAS